MCQHKCLVSPNISNALLCAHCNEAIAMPLEAHFVCPANLERQFAILSPFDIEGFLACQAHEIVDSRSSRAPAGEPRSSKKDGTSIFVGFMDVTITKAVAHSPASGAPGGIDGRDIRQPGKKPADYPNSKRSGGFWSSLFRLCVGAGSTASVKRNSTTASHLFAVMTATTLSWYSLHASLVHGKSYKSYERMCTINIPDMRFTMHDSGKRIVIHNPETETAVEMDLGSRIVADMWFHALTRNTRRGSSNQQRRVAHFNPLLHEEAIADEYSSSGLADDDRSDADTVKDYMNTEGVASPRSVRFYASSLALLSIRSPVLETNDQQQPMQANGISNGNSNGGSSIAQNIINGQPGYGPNRRIDDTTDTNSTPAMVATAAAAEDDSSEYSRPAETQQRRRLVQGRPAHSRVVSDTNSELSSVGDASDSDFSDYGRSGNSAANRPQVAMKAPRANHSAVAQNQQQELMRPAGRGYNEGSSSSELSAPSDDGDFTMSDIEDDFNESMDDELDAPGISEDSSDGDWGAKPRKRKPKKAAPTKANKKAKGAGAKGPRAKSQKNLLQYAAAASQANRTQRSPEYSDSEDSDFYVGSRKPKKSQRAKPKRPKAVQSYLDGSDSDYGSSDYRSLRQSTRDSAVKSYAEDEGDYPGVDFEDDLDDTPKSKAKNKNSLPLIDEDTGEDIIEHVRDFRLRGDAKDKSANDMENIEFYVKWKGWSYRHATWDTASFLKDFKGYKKVENYFKQVVLYDHAVRTDPEASREDIEQLDINREMERDTLRDYTKIERIVTTRPATSARRVREHGNAPAHVSQPTSQAGDSVEYLVKWRRLPYNACSWVTADEIGEDEQAELDAFLDREQSLCLPHRSASTNKAKRPKFQRLIKQPEYLVGGELRDYQMTSLNWMAHLWCNDENGILADEMGLGKTIQTISFLSYLFHTQEIFGPFLVVVPLSTIGAWQREFARWAPDMNTICYIDDNRSRAIMREFEFYKYDTNPPKAKLNVLLTTYELVLKDREFIGSIKWNFLAVDEAHRLKNSESQLHEALSSFHITNRLLVTGTPLQNTVKELVTLCRFLSPARFADLDCDFDIRVSAGDAEQESKIADLHRRLKPYMLRRLKKDVEKSLPNRTEQILRVELSGMQVHYYKNILTRNYAVLNRNATGSGQMSLLNIMVELKKASNHPYLFPNAETMSDNKEEALSGIIAHSGKMVLLDKLLAKLKNGGHRVLIFSQMVRMLDILADYMALRGYAFQRLDGSVPSEVRKRSIEHYNAPGSPDFVFLLSTRAGGLGINLETADTVILYDSDFNPQADMQAMARAHRIGQKRQVAVYRFVSKNTIEEDILERAKRKMVLEYCIIKGMDTSGLHVTDTERKQIERSKQGKSGGIIGSSSGGSSFSREELAAILKFGASSMFADDSVTMQHKLDDMDLDKMLEDAEQADTSEAGVADDFLSQFKVADYGGSGMSWDEIIPEEDRRRAEFEELQKQEEELLMRRRRARVSYAEDGTLIGTGDGNSSDDSTASSSRVRRRAAGSSSQSRRRNEGRSSDPKSFSEKEVRALIRGVQKFGSTEHRFDQVVAEAELEGKDADAVKAVCQELVKSCEDALRSHLHGGSAGSGGGAGEVDSAAGGDDDDLVGGYKRNAKAILLTFRGVHSVNAGVVTQRATDLAVLCRRIEQPSLREDPTKFRIGVPLKPVHHWSCLWGQREDAMLLVGIYRHGFGNWDKIQADPDLGLQKKLFLTPADEKAASVQSIGGSVRGGPSAGKRIVAPKATHLVRRGEYLLKILREGEERKSNPGLNLAPGSSAPSRAAGARKRRGRSDEGSDTNSANAHDSHGQNNEGGGRASGDAEDGELSEPESMDERACKDLMRPVKRYLQRLRDEAEHTKSADSKVKLISECLLPIGRHIRSVIERKRSRSGAPPAASASDPLEDLTRLNRHLWVFVTYFWRSPVNYQRLVHLFERLEASSLAAPQAASHQGSAGSPTTKHLDAGVSSPGGVDRRNSYSRNRSRSRSRSRSSSRSRSRDSDRRDRRSMHSDLSDEGEVMSADAKGVSSPSSRRRTNGSVASHHRLHHHHRPPKSSSRSNGTGHPKSGVRPSRKESRRQQ
ncbi:ATP-dependent DNA helicase Hrp3 [Dipsacomyces acuminosporus]|nr:ATP-dependent DNA helicase Hrp3 [Dipsacomyces acuminosporus]